MSHGQNPHEVNKQISFWLPQNWKVYCGITLYRLIINPADIVDRSHIFLVLRIFWKYMIGFLVKDDKVQNFIHDIKKANFQVLAV